MIGIKKTSGFINSSDNTKIYYEVIGEGPPIILSYGIACTINHWNTQVKYFSKNHSVVLYDYRGHHKSSIPDDLNSMNVPAIAEDLKNLCDHLQINKASFWSHSFGAQVVLALYQRHPEIFDSLVLVNGFHKNPIKGMFGQDMVPAFNKLKKMYEELPETFQFFWSSLVDSPLALPVVTLTGGFNIRLTDMKDIEVYLRGVKSIPLKVFLSLFENMMQFDGSSTLESITCPSLILAGDKDNVTPYAFQKEMHDKIKNSELQVIPYGSHCSQLDMPDFVNLKIEAFMDDLKNK